MYGVFVSLVRSIDFWGKSDFSWRPASLDIGPSQGAKLDRLNSQALQVCTWSGLWSFQTAQQVYGDRVEEPSKQSGICLHCSGARALSAPLPTNPGVSIPE